MRALSLRTLTYIDIPQVVNCINQILPQAISDTDPYVRKTAALCIGKMFNFDPKYSEAESYMNQLEILINDGNYAVMFILIFIRVHDTFRWLPMRSFQLVKYSEFIQV